jgi:energy-converting hydrogenase A subunit R
MLPIQLHTGCEGPLAFNDNGFELCRELLPPLGDRFFTQLRRYGDYLAAIANPPESQAGDILKLIGPFLKARGLNNAALREFSAGNLRLLTGAAEAYRFLHGFGFPIFEISTSYRQFAEAVGGRLGFDQEHTLGTELDLDRYPLGSGEAGDLRRLEEEILGTPDIELPPGAASLTELPAPVQEAIGLLEEIFRERLPRMEIGALYREISPVGGAEKARFVADSLAGTGLKLADTIYVGDGLTDVPAFQAVRDGGGLAISFNGDRYALKAAEVAVVSDSAWPIGLLTAIFRLWGKEGVLEVASPERRGKSRALVLPEEMIEPIALGLQGRRFNLYQTQGPDLERLAQESEAMRASLRGEAIAAME